MSLNQRIKDDYITAYKAKDAVRLGVLRHLKTAATNLAVELKRDVTDDELLDVVRKQAKQRVDSIGQFRSVAKDVCECLELNKQRVDSIGQFRSGGREDLALKEEEELAVLREYLPEMLEGAALAAAVDAAIAKTNASGPRDMGKVMTSLMTDYKGRLDGKLASALVREKLA